MVSLLDASRGHRAFWLLVALAVGLLVNVSFTAAEAAPASLLRALARDLGALQIQVERLQPLQADERSGRAHPADLGDGSPAFLWQAGEQMVRRAKRRVGRLQELARSIPAVSAPAGTLWVEIYELELELTGLRQADRPEVAEARRAEALVRLERLQQLLPILQAWLREPAEAAAVVPAAIGGEPDGAG